MSGVTKLVNDGPMFVELSFAFGPMLEGFCFFLRPIFFRSPLL